MLLKQLKKNVVFDLHCEMGNKKVGKEYKGTWLVTKADILEYIHSENLEKFPGKKFDFG